MESGRQMRRIKARKRRARDFCVFRCVSAKRFVRLSEFVKRFFVAFGLLALMASSGVKSFSADCLAVGEEVVERAPTGKFNIGVASRMHQVICWNRVS